MNEAAVKMLRQSYSILEEGIKVRENVVRKEEEIKLRCTT